MMLKIQRTLDRAGFLREFPKTASLVIPASREEHRFGILEGFPKPMGCAYTGPELITISLNGFLSHEDWGFFLIKED